MRVQTDRSSNMHMMGSPTPTSTSTATTPRRIVPHQIRPSFLHSFLHFLQKPHSLPFVLTLFLFLAWISIRMYRASSNFSAPTLSHSTTHADFDANLVRFTSSMTIPSHIAKDTRGWLLDPLSLAISSGISGGAVTCASLHVGEIRPGRLRGNHRHHDCNETFVIWGAATKFRLENSKAADKGYAEVTIGKDEIAVAASPSHAAHALVNVDPIRSTFFIGCQDSIINYNASSSDFNVWKDL